MAEFKHHNGFIKMNVPKYYLPLSVKGSIGLKLNLHHDLSTLLPQGLLSYLRKIRTKWYQRRVQ
jgi:hypothetical protein